MWWNNVETKPGTGYPTKWEDQEQVQGWLGEERQRQAAASSRPARRKVVPNIFHNPHMPSMDDYYEPWTYDYQNLFNAPEGLRPADRRTDLDDHRREDRRRRRARTGTTTWAARRSTPPTIRTWKDSPNSSDCSSVRVERLVFFYLPRICNHCLNPCCVASCPSGALYKRGEDGIVLIDQKRCRAWRSCVAACPYKKTYFNWFTGKSGEVHPLLPAAGDRPGAGLFPLLRRTHSLPGRAALRRRSDGRSRQAAGRRAGRRTALADPRSASIPR